MKYIVYLMKMRAKEKNLGKERGRCVGQGSCNLQYKKNLKEKVAFV